MRCKICTVYYAPFAIPVCHAVYVGCLWMFQDNLSFPSSKVKPSRKNARQPVGRLLFWGLCGWRLVLGEVRNQSGCWRLCFVDVGGEENESRRRNWTHQCKTGKKKRRWNWRGGGTKVGVKYEEMIRSAGIGGTRVKVRRAPGFFP